MKFNIIDFTYYCMNCGSDGTLLFDLREVEVVEDSCPKCGSDDVDILDMRFEYEEGE